MIVIAAVGEAGIDGSWLVAADGEALDVSVTIEEEGAAVARPVGCLEASFGK